VSAALWELAEHRSVYIVQRPRLIASRPQAIRGRAEDRSRHPGDGRLHTATTWASSPPHPRPVSC